MKNLFFMLLGVMLLGNIGCEDNPADTRQPFPDSNSGSLSGIDIGGARTLVLAGAPPASLATRSASLECKKLGKLKGAVYSELVTESEGGDLSPCFSGVAFWKSGAIYGKYRPDDSSIDAWFATDEEGVVYHLPGEPRKGAGFKNEKRIKTYKGRPVYLSESGRLVSFRFEDGTTDQLTESAVDRYVILDRKDGEHLVYRDKDKSGKRVFPGGEVESLNEIESTGFFYENSSHDLGYSDGTYFKNMTFDASGGVVERAYSSQGASWYEFITNPQVGMIPPSGVGFGGSAESCERDGELMICGGRGFLIADSSQDMQNINWCSFGHCSQLSPKSCLGDDFIFYYSENNLSPATRQLTRISRDLSSDSVILTNIEIELLVCVAGGELFISGYNVDSSSDETFMLEIDENGDKTKTPISAPISKFIH